MRKPDFCICENKDADQLRGNHEADQRLCFCYTDSTILLLPKYEITSLYSCFVTVQPVCVGPGRKPRRLVFSQRGSYHLPMVKYLNILTSSHFAVNTLKFKQILPCSDTCTSKRAGRISKECRP